MDISLEDEMKINKGSYISIVNSFLGGAELHIHLNKFVSDYYKPGDSIEGRMTEDMMQSVQEDLLPSVEAMLPKIDSILGGLEKIVNHPALTQSLEHEVSTRQLNQLLASDVPVIVSNLKTITANFSDVSGELKTLDLQSTVQSINATLANLKVTTEKFNSKDNTLGLLLNDRALYDNLNATTDNASKLLLDLRENPKRYVHFSVF